MTKASPAPSPVERSSPDKKLHGSHLSSDHRWPSRRQKNPCCLLRHESQRTPRLPVYFRFAFMKRGSFPSSFSRPAVASVQPDAKKTAEFGYFDPSKYRKQGGGGLPFLVRTTGLLGTAAFTNSSNKSGVPIWTLLPRPNSRAVAS